MSVTDTVSRSSSSDIHRSRRRVSVWIQAPDWRNAAASGNDCATHEPQGGAPRAKNTDALAEAGSCSSPQRAKQPAGGAISPRRAKEQAVRPCPFCAEQVQNSAILCRWCGMRIVPTPVRTRTVMSGRTPWARAGLILGGLLIALSSVLPWASVVLLGDLNLVQISQAAASPLPPIALTVIGTAGIACGLLVRSVRASRATAVIFGVLSGMLTVTLLVQFLRLTSQLQPLASTAVGPWIAVLGTGAALVGAAFPTPGSSPGPAGSATHNRVPANRSQHAVVASTVGVLLIAGVAAAILLGGALRAPTISSSSATSTPPPLAQTAVPAPSVQLLPNYSPPDPTLTSPSPTPAAPNSLDGANLAHAESVVQEHGYTPDPNSSWTRTDGLNVITATVTGSADGYDRRAFFFYGDRYLGTDATQSSADVSETWSTADTVALSYRLYNQPDPACCPTGGSALVRFEWNGTQLRPLDVIPSADADASDSRR